MKKTGVFDCKGIELQVGDIVKVYSLSKDGREVEIEPFGSRIPGAFTYRPVGAKNPTSSYLLCDLIRPSEKIEVLRTAGNGESSQDRTEDTLFDRIKAMDVVDLAIYINKLQTDAVFRYQEGCWPQSIIENVNILNKK